MKRCLGGGRILLPKEVAEMHELLTELATYLEMSIKCNCAPGEKLPREKWIRAELRRDVANLRRARRLVSGLGEGPVSADGAHRGLAQAWIENQDDEDFW